MGVTWYSQPSRSLAGGMTKWVMRIWKPRLGLWRCRRFASAVVPSAKQASVTIQIVRILRLYWARVRVVNIMVEV